MRPILTSRSALREIFAAAPAAFVGCDMSAVEPRAPWAMQRRCGAAQFMAYLQDMPVRLQEALLGRLDGTLTIPQLRVWCGVGRLMEALGFSAAEVRGADGAQYVAISQEIATVTQALTQWRP